MGRDRGVWWEGVFERMWDCKAGGMGQLNVARLNSSPLLCHLGLTTPPPPTPLAYSASPPCRAARCTWRSP